MAQEGPVVQAAHFSLQQVEGWVLCPSLSLQLHALGFLLDFGSQEGCTFLLPLGLPVHNG